MLPARPKRLAATALLALVLTGAASDAFAIRNRYTNEQNEGFAALLLGAFGRPGFVDDQPLYRGDRQPLRRGIVERADEPPPGF